MTETRKANPRRVGLSALIRPGCLPPQQTLPPEHPTAFLDRDGVINWDKAYVARIEDWEWVTRAPEAVDWLLEQGYLVVVITNQSGIARGYYTESQLRELSLWLLQVLPLTAIYYCPHGPESDCPARKPGIGMLTRAEAELGVEKESSFMLGDKDSDMEAAARFGIRAEKFLHGDLLAAVKNFTG